VGWTGRLVAHHLAAKHGASYSVRHCRRLLRRLKPSPSPVLTPATELATSRGWIGFSDSHHADVALRRISRLASAQLPLAPFMWTVFDLLDQVMDLRDAPDAFIECSDNGFRWLFRNLDARSVIDAMEQARVFSRDPVISGIRTNLADVPNFRREVIEPDELMSEFFHRSPAYHEFYKPTNLHLGMVGVLREHGELLGALPVWKGCGSGPFTPLHVKVLQAAIPHIAHGLQLSRLLARRPADSSEGFSPSRSVAGVVILNSMGKVVAADEKARSIFAQIGVFDGRPSDAFAAARIRMGFEYIGRTIRTILFDRKSAPAEVGAPVVKIWSHATGLTIRLRGHVAEDAIGREMTTVFVEQGESAPLFRKRLQFRFGLSEREAEVLALMKQNTRRSEIAVHLGISQNTVKTYVRQISAKLCDCGQPMRVIKLSETVLSENWNRFHRRSS
jgi:DNA-binding CsgD family transcriptional regulator